MSREDGRSMGQFIMPENEGRDFPKVLRDRQRRIIWKLPRNTLEENERLGISNMQGLLLEKFPEFNEMFPRGEDGKIAEDKIEEAKKFILQRISKQHDFNTIFGSSPNARKKAPYFEGSYILARNKAFLPWGIDLEEREEEIRTFIENIESEAIRVKPQMQGIKALVDFFEGKQSFSELKPFFINKAWFNGKGFGQVHLAKSGVPRKTISMTLNKEASKILQEGKRLLAIPREDSCRYYHWIDFYEVWNSNIVNIEHVIDSLRVDIKNSTFTGMGWHGQEIQLFLDFLLGERAIGHEQLKDFKTKIANNGRYNIAPIGRISGKNIRVNISDSECFPGQEITFKIKKIDEVFNLLQGSVIDADNLERLVCERKFCKGDLKLSMLEEDDNTSTEFKNMSTGEANEELTRFLEVKDE